MAEGLLQMLGSGQQAQQQQQGNLLGGLFQSESQARRQGRERLLGQALQIAQQQDPIRSGFAIAGGLLGEGIGRAMGKVTPEEARQQKFAGLQTQLMQEGLDPAQDPAGFYTRVAELSQKQGDLQTALRAAAKARQFATEPVKTERVIRGGTPEGDAAGLSEGESAIGTYVDGKRTSLKNMQTIDEETPPSRIREYEIALQRGLINPDTSLEEYNQMRAGGGRSSVTPTETQLRPYAAVISSNEDLNERIRSLVKNADPATLGDFNIPFTGGRDQNAVDAVSLQTQQRAAEIRSDNAELTIEQALEQAIDELSQGRGEPTPDENASGGQAGTATPQNDPFAGKVNP